MNEEIKILIADDHPIFRRGLRAVIESDPALKVVAEAANGRDALEQIITLEPDVAVLDVNMPLMDGLAVAREIRSKNLPTRAVFLTMHADEAIFNAALESDVKCFIIKDGAADEIINCIKSVVRGRSYFSSALSGFLLNRRAEKSPLENLTATERRVLRLVAEGLTSREIAERLFISPRTVEHHREHIREKLDLKGQNALFAFALSNKDKI